MKLIFTIILLTLIALPSWAKIEIPRTVMSPHDILSEARGPLEAKMKQMANSYISHITKNVITYSSDSELNCKGRLIPATTPIATVQLNHYINAAGSLVEIISYMGCKEDTNFKEVVVTKGSNLKPISMEDILEGKREFKLKDNETAKSYQIINFTGTSFFTVELKKKENKIFVDYKTAEQLFLSAVYTYKEDRTDLQLTFYGYSFHYSLGRYGNWGSNVKMDQVTLFVTTSGVKYHTTHYYNDKNQLTSLFLFQKMFNEMLKDWTLENTTGILEFYVSMFPDTSNGSSLNSGKNERILNELKLAQVKILGNTDINYVKNLIIELIDSIENGKMVIDDLRPKK